MQIMFKSTRICLNADHQRTLNAELSTPPT